MAYPDIMLPRYLDAGTGSAIWSAVTSGLAGLTVVIRIFWFRIIKFITKVVRKFAKKTQ
jgi:hypothetical protein